MASNCQFLTSDDSIECGYLSSFQRLFSVPLGAFLDHVYAAITVGVNPKYGNTIDSDFWAVLSDGSEAVGIFVVDRKNYGSYEPCVLVEGTPGASFTNQKIFHYGPKISKNNPYPQKYKFLISTHQQSGACQTATEMEGAYTTAGYYNATLEVGSQLTLDIYSDDDTGEKYNFRYIAVDIHVGL